MGHILTLGANTGNYKTGRGVCDVCGKLYPTGELMACSECQADYCHACCRGSRGDSST